MRAIPEIRFPDFAEPWEQRKLSDILDRRIEHRQQSEEYPRLAFAAGQGVIPLNERKTNNREQLTKDEFTKQYLVTELNDIVYNPANVKYGAIDRNKLGKGLISPIYVTFITNEIPGFIERILTSHDFQQRALRFEEGTVTKRQSVNPEDLVTLDVFVAPQKLEQQKISEFFDSIDNLITLHQREAEQLRVLKRGLLQKMFPQEGQLIPAIRFPGFTESWEQRKLSDVTEEFQSGKFIAAAEIIDKGEYPVFGGNGLRGYCNKYNHDGEFALIGRQGALCGNMNYSRGKAYFTEHAIAVKANNSSNTRFLFYLLGKMNLGQYSDQSAQPGLAVGKLVKLENTFPSKAEQDKIGDCFERLDNLIALHQREYDKLTVLKHGFLQKMYI